ncbi:MAG: hypothetical protein KC994_21630 [Candidatus Omnitrophica bacterium]|nr:hypothetical protein [Candidatus Omnitrophota bacterium]
MIGRSYLANGFEQSLITPPLATGAKNPGKQGLLNLISEFTVLSELREGKRWRLRYDNKWIQIASFAEVARVRVETIEAHEPSTASSSEPLGKAIQQFSGIAEGLPADMAENHDHHLHGQPAR